MASKSPMIDAEVGVRVLDDVEALAEQLEPGSAIDSRTRTGDGRGRQTRTASRYASSARDIATPALDRRAASTSSSSTAASAVVMSKTS